MMQIREEVAFTKGRIIVRGKLVTRGKPKRADYILYYKPNIPITVVEAKDNNHSVGDGMQQALDYAVTLNIPFVFSSNGDGFVFHDRTGLSAEKEASLTLDQFPLPSSSGPNTASGKASPRTKKKSSCRIISMTAAARLRATTSPMPSMPR
jgi:type I restriction enzyme, R subunit